MRRRDFVTVLVGGVAASPLLLPRAARAQRTAGMPMLGILMPGIEQDQDRQLRLAAFRTALAKLGWSEGNNLRIEIRWGAEDPALFARYAAELVALSPSVLLCDGSAALEALRRQTRTAPIVFVTVGDPVGQSFVQSLARPGGNITGFSSMDASLAEKWLEMLTQIDPPVKSVAVLYNPATFGQLMIRSVEEAAPPFGISVRIVSVEDVAGIEAIAAGLAMVSLAMRRAGESPVRPIAKNRVLRVPATTDPGDSKSPGSQPPKGGRASFSPRQSTGPRLDRPRVRSDLCRKATTSHVRTSRPTDRFLHGRNGATVDDILGSGD